MADQKISQLTAATTPLAGTEVLPLVQSSTTKKVAVDDLTVKNIRSNATTGLLQIAGPAAAATRIMTVPDANFSAARIDAAQSFTGNQTLSTGNLIVGTAGKGVDFSANTNAAGMTSELLTWYEEGTFTPSIIGTVTNPTQTYTHQRGFYTRIGRTVICDFYVQMAASGISAGSGTARLEGLPFAITSGANIFAGSGTIMYSTNWATTNAGGPMGLYGVVNTTQAVLRVVLNYPGAKTADGVASASAADVGNTTIVSGSLTYQV